MSHEGDQLDYVDDEIADLRRSIASSEAAEHQHRLEDVGEWRASLERRRRRLAELEELRDEMVAAEESEAELEHGGAT